MSKYQCSTCKTVFNKKNHLDNHLNRKNKCKPLIENPSITAIVPLNNSIFPINDSIAPLKNSIAPLNISIFPLNDAKILPKIGNGTIPTQINHKTLLMNDNVTIPIQNNNVTMPTQNIHKCNYCDKEFARKDNLTKHMKMTCKVLKQQNKDRQEIFDKLVLLESKNKQLEEEIKNKDKIIEDKDKVIENKDKHLEEDMKILRDEIKAIQSISVKNSNNNNNNTLTNINNNTVNVINIVPHGKEPLNENKSNDLLLIIATKKGYNAVLEIITRVHFNENYPEFQNIYVPNIKNNNVMVYNQKWELKSIEEVISNLHDTKSDYIIENKDIFYEHLNINEQLVYARWAARLCNRNSAEYKEYITDMHKKIKLLMYNKRDMVLATKKLQQIKK